MTPHFTQTCYKNVGEKVQNNNNITNIYGKVIK